MVHILLKVVQCADNPLSPVMETLHLTVLYTGWVVGQEVEIPVYCVSFLWIMISRLPSSSILERYWEMSESHLCSAMWHIWWRTSWILLRWSLFSCNFPGRPENAKGVLKNLFREFEEINIKTLYFAFLGRVQFNNSFCTSTKSSSLPCLPLSRK